jgi:hypothetical protein
MKNFVSIFVVFILAIFTMVSCSKSDSVPEGDTPPQDESTNVEFLSRYHPGSENVLGDQDLVVMLTVSNGEISYSTILNVYPEHMITDCDINNNIVAMGLYWREFDNQGIYFDMDAESYYEFPLVDPSEDSDYSYFQATTADVADNGLIVYSSATNDKNYGDEYRPFLLRLNPSDHSTVVASSPNNFAFSQPEMGGDTDMAQFNRMLFASTDGQYAYGHIEAYGTEGGSIHWDYNILFKYDFDNDIYERLGDPEDNKVNIVAMTSDRKYMIYTNNGTYKLLNLETNTTSYPTGIDNLVNVQENSWGVNGACVGSTAGNIWNKDFVNNREFIVCNMSGSPYNCMFSKDGKKIIFTLDGSDTKYLCITSGIEENSTYDTIGAYPNEFEGLVMVK